jgi:hypothetical protein
MIDHLGMGLPRKGLEGWNFVELASLVDVPDEMADLWEELGQDRTKLAANLREFKEEMASHEGSEAIYWNHFELAHVRVCQIQLSSTSVFARLHFIPFPDEVRFRLRVRSFQPFAHSWRRSWRCDPLLWTAADRTIFFSRDVIDEVIRIRAAFPYTSTFEFPGRDFFPMLKSMIKPLELFLVQTASGHLQNLSEMLDDIRERKHVPTTVQVALQAVAASLPSYPSLDGLGDLLTFIVETESEAGRSFTKAEADQLGERAYVIGRVLGGPF